MMRKLWFVFPVALMPIIFYFVYYLKNLAEPVQLLFIIPSCFGIGFVCVILCGLHTSRVGRQCHDQMKNISFYFSFLCAVAFIIIHSIQLLSGFSSYRPGSPFAMVNFVLMPVYLVPVILTSYCIGWLTEWVLTEKNVRMVRSIYVPILILGVIALFIFYQSIVRQNPSLARYNPIHFLSSPGIHYAAQEGDICQVEKLIKKGIPVNLPKADSYKSTPLHLAALHGQDKMIEFLISHGAEINARDASFQTPLHKACQTGYLNSVRTLTRLGAVINSQNQVGNTPLFEAARKGYVDIVSFLVKSGADVNMKNYMGQTPLFMAVWYNYPEIVSILLSNDARIDFVDINGKTPLMMAKEKGFLEIEKRLRKD